MQSVMSIHKKLRKVLPRLDERQQRLVAAAEASPLDTVGLGPWRGLQAFRSGGCGIVELAQRKDPIP